MSVQKPNLVDILPFLLKNECRLHVFHPDGSARKLMIDTNFDPRELLSLFQSYIPVNKNI